MFKSAKFWVAWSWFAWALSTLAWAWSTLVWLLATSLLAASALLWACAWVWLALSKVCLVVSTLFFNCCSGVTVVWTLSLFSVVGLFVTLSALALTVNAVAETTAVAVAINLIASFFIVLAPFFD